MKFAVYSPFHYAVPSSTMLVTGGNCSLVCLFSVLFCFLPDIILETLDSLFEGVYEILEV